jgi:predicted nucleic acid-binding protein
LTNAALARQLNELEVWCHPFVVGELAYGQLEARSEVLSLLSALPQAPLAGHDEVLAFVDSNRLAGTGIGWIDAHLLAAARLAGADPNPQTSFSDLLDRLGPFFTPLPLRRRLPRTS